MTLHIDLSQDVVFDDGQDVTVLLDDRRVEVTEARINLDTVFGLPVVQIPGGEA